MRLVRCELIRRLSDDPQPGWVEARLVDAYGRSWRFEDKPPVFGEGVLGCELLGTRIDPDGRVIATIGTERPWGLASVEGVTTFDVRPDQFVPVWLEEEAAAVAARLAPLLGAEAKAIDDALRAAFERDSRNPVSLLASAEYVAALLARVEDREAHRARVLAGDISGVANALSEELAGPFDVAWDGNWPPSVARKRLRGALPPGARPGDILVGGDGGGTRIEIRVVADDDGVLTGHVLFPETWRDSPLEDVWIAAYRRLEAAYPDAIPPGPP